MVRALEFPRRISVELTNYCNQRCVLCPRQGFTRPLGFMTDEIFERIALECAGRDTVLWLHFLGEPLLHPHVGRLIAFAKRVGVRQVGLSTNAVSLSGRRAQDLLDAGLDRLECSIDAVDSQGFLAMRGRDHFDKVTANIRGFLEHKKALGLTKPITSLQFMWTPAIEAALPRIRQEWTPALGPQDFIMTIVPFPFGGASEAAMPMPMAPLPPGRRPPCRWLFEMLIVLQDGTVAMCNVDWDARVPLGNVRESTIHELWTGDELERRRAAHLASRFDELSPCSDCRDWPLADGHGYVNVLARPARDVVQVTGGVP